MYELNDWQPGAQFAILLNGSRIKSGMTQRIRARPMKKVNDYIKEKMRKDPHFRARYDLAKEKAKVSKKVIEYRNKHDLSQAQFARQIGVSQQYISKIEEGDFSNINTVEKLLSRIGFRLEIKVIPMKMIRRRPKMGQISRKI